MEIRGRMAIVLGIGFVLSAFLSLYLVQVDKNSHYVSPLTTLTLVLFWFALGNGMVYLVKKRRNREKTT
jgi:ABC-type nitrate/sulfonate/bicarbonate transport system permease component